MVETSAEHSQEEKPATLEAVQMCRPQDLPACCGDERTPLLAHVVLVLPPAEAGLRPWSGLTAKELAILAADPFWVRARRIAMCTFWALWLSLLVAAMALILSSPACADPACDENLNSTAPVLHNTTALGDIADSSLEKTTIAGTILHFG